MIIVEVVMLQCITLRGVSNILATPYSYMTGADYKPLNVTHSSTAPPSTMTSVININYNY